MNIWNSLIIVILIIILNSIVYILFKRYLYGKPDAGMKFLLVNLSKDVVWLIISLLIIDKTKADFLFIVVCFIIASFLIYLSIIKLINKS